MRASSGVASVAFITIATIFVLESSFIVAQRRDEDVKLLPREVPARSLPVPMTVSPELQKAIAAPPKLNPNLVPKNADEWRALQTLVNGASTRHVAALAKQLDVAIVPTTVAGVACFRLTPTDIPAAHRARLLVHLHGGAFVLFAGEAGAGEGVLVAHFAKTEVLSVDYRMPPEFPFPAALDDAVAVWKEVIKDHDPAKTALFGTSAGGGLTMSSVLKLRELQLPVPGALFIGTPASDLTTASDSLCTNEYVDGQLVTCHGLIDAALKLYAGDHDMAEPLLSPVYGDLHGFPPSILISGTRDLLLSNTVRAHRKLRQAGVDAELQVFEGQSHAQYLTAYPCPESDDAMGEIAKFFDKHLAKQSSRSAK
jgi:epsilon-lactone hydrolase